MDNKQILMVSGLALTMTGCSTVTERWAPFPAQEELASFGNRWEAAQKNPRTPIVDMQRELVKYRDEIYKRALERSKLEWESSGLTTYGGLAAVAGALADRTGLLNTGAGIAAFGLTNSSRYRFSEQTQIYVAALKKLACITGKVNSADDTTVALAAGSSDPAAQETAMNFTHKVIAAVDAVRTEYTNALLGMVPNVPSREELLALVTKYRPIAAGVAGATATDQEVRDAAGATVVNLMTDIQSCSK